MYMITTSSHFLLLLTVTAGTLLSTLDDFFADLGIEDMTTLT